MKFFLELSFCLPFHDYNILVRWPGEEGGIATRRKPFLTRNSFHPRRSREPEARQRKREREISFDSRHVEEIYSRIAYADRCAHLRSSFSGAVSSKCLDFCLDFRVLENLSMASLELCQVLAGMKVSPEMFARDEVSEGRKEFLPRVFVES